MPKRSLAALLCAALVSPGPVFAANLKSGVSAPRAAVPALPTLPAIVAPALNAAPSLPAITASPKVQLQAAVQAAAAPAQQPAAQTAAKLDQVFSGAAKAEAPAVSVDAAVAADAPSVETSFVSAEPYAALRSVLRRTFPRLALDRHRDPSAKGFRRRAAAELEVRADGTILATPGATFRSGQAEARLPGIAPEVVNSADFRRLVADLVAKLPEQARKRGVRVSVHQMRVVDGAVTEGPHQDPNTDYLAIWAVDRSNAAGGETVLSKDAAGADVTLRTTLDSSKVVLFDNRALFHDATPLSRVDARREAKRDALVLAFSVLPEAAASLELAQRAEGYKTIRAELAKPSPDAEKLRGLYETGDPRLQRSLYRAFKRWSRYFSLGANESSWWFLKKAAAPWAGHVYVRKLVSVLEFLGQAQNRPIDAEKAAKEIHEADHDFARRFVEEAEKRAPQGLDPEEAADAISDSVIFPALIEPFMERRQKGAYDRKLVMGDIAKRLKETVYLYSPMTVEQITGVLSDPSVQQRLDHLMDLLEAQMPEDPRGPTSSSASQLPARSSGRRHGSSGSTMAALAVIAASAAFHAIFGFGGEAGFAAAMAIGAVSDMRGDKRAPQPEQPAAAPPKQANADGPSPYLVDLTMLARRGEIPPIYLRDAETQTAVQILNQTSYNNVILIGEPGVGKTAIAEGLALRMAQAKTGTPLDGQRMLLLDIGKFMADAAGSPDRFAAAVEEIVAEAADGNTVLVIDEAHQLARDPSMPVMQMGSFFDQIKRVMTQGRLKLMLATTRDEYNRFFAADRALESRSQVLYVDPVPEGLAMELVYRIRGQFEKGVTVSFGAAKASVELTVRAFRFDALLRMAIKALDTAATRLRLRPAQVKARLLDERHDLLYRLDLLRQARAEGDLERQENLVPQIDAAIKRYRELEAESLQPVRTEVAREDVAEALSSLGAPVHSLKAGTQEYIDGIETLLRENLIGHDKLITQTVEAIKRRFAQPNLRKPIFSALLLGPTGTGKTEFARLLARALFGITDVEKGVIKIDGGAHQHKHDISRIQGSPPGYVGFNATETLMDQVRRKPESIILIDEVEKMHPDILNLFLSILEDGTAKDSTGRPVDFSHTVIVFTSNFGVPPGDYEKMSDEEFVSYVRAQLKQPFPVSPFKPEMLNRPSLVDVFTPLKKEEVRAIVMLRVSQLVKTWKDVHGVDVRFEDAEAATETLLAEGFDPRNGARPVNRAVDARLEGPLSNLLITQALRRGDRITFTKTWDREIAHAPGDQSKPRLSDAALEGLVAGAQAPLTMDDLDRALATKLARAEREAAPALEQSAQLTDHRPNLTDAKLKEALERISADAKAAGADAELAAKTAKALAMKAKSLDLEAQTRSVEGPAWTRGFVEMEKEAAGLGETAKAALLKKVQGIVQAANGRTVTLSWGKSGETFTISARASGRLTYEEEDKLVALLSLPDAASDRLVQARDGAFDQARRAARSAGGRFAYEGGETPAVWAELPLTAAPVIEAPKPEPVVEAPKPEPVKVQRRAPARVDDPALEPQRVQLARRASLLTDANLTEREVEQIHAEIARALSDKPELASMALRNALWTGADAFVNYVAHAREGNNTQLEDMALDRSGGLVRPALRFRAFFELSRRLAEVRPDLVPENIRADILKGLSIGETRNRGYYYNLQAESQAACDWVWKEVAELGLALAEREPELVAPDWLMGILSKDQRWAPYQFERESAKFADPAVAPEALAHAVKVMSGMDKLPASVLARLAEAVDGFAQKPSSEPPPRVREAARLLEQATDKQLDEVVAAVAGPMKKWLAPDAEAWLGHWATDLALSLERKKLGSMPWKELAAKLQGDDRWTQLELLRHAAVLLDAKSSAEAVVEAANALGRAIEERPKAASEELETMLWHGITVHLEELGKDRNARLPDASFTLVGGRAQPVRRVRELYALYGKLLKTRADLVPATAPARLEKAMDLRRTQQYQPHYDSLYRRDPKAIQVAQWTWKQLVDLSLTVAAARPDAVEVRHALGWRDKALARAADGRRWTPLDGWTLGISIALAAAWGIAKYNDVPLPWLTAALAALPYAARHGYNLVRHWLDGAPYRAFEAKLRQRLVARAQQDDPTTTLRLIGSFDQETGKWSPAKGRAALFKELRKWKEFDAAAKGEGLGRALPGDEDRLLELAKTLTAKDTPEDTARDAAQRLTAALSANADRADAALEARLREAVDEVAARAMKGNEKVAALGKGRFGPALRSRGVVEAYQRLLALRPDLAQPDQIRATLHKLFALEPSGASAAAGAWLQRRGAEIAATLLAARPEAVAAVDQHAYYAQSLRASSAGLDGARPPSNLGLTFWLASLGTSAAAFVWLKWHWAIFGAAGAAVVAAAAGLAWLVGRLRAKDELAKLDADLEATLTRALRRGTPRAALDLLGEYDAEKEAWFPKAGMKAPFERLKREWPEFKAAAK